MERLEREIAAKGPRGAKSRRANFTCALSLAWPGGDTRTFEGRIFGRLVWPPRGTKGFGYDPIFYIPEKQRTFAEMSSDEKNAISHRGIAFRKMAVLLEKLYGIEGRH